MAYSYTLSSEYKAARFVGVYVQLWNLELAERTENIQHQMLQIACV